MSSAVNRDISVLPGLRDTVRYNSTVQLTPVDWLVVALYFLFNLAIGFYYKSRAGKNVNEFFLSALVREVRRSWETILDRRF